MARDDTEIEGKVAVADISKMTRVYDYDDHDLETFRCTADLAECLPDQWDQIEALSHVQTSGRFWCGGGAAPLVLLLRAK